MEKIYNIKFNSLSNVDDIGRVFTYDGRIMRGIYPNGVKTIKELFEQGLIYDLESRGYIPKTSITEYYTDDFPMILEHECVKTVSYFSEWTFDMIKDAGLFIIELERYLRKHGWRLKDCHPYNILFSDKGNCLYVDIGSIVPLDGKNRSFIMEFDAFYTYPVGLYSHYPELMSKIIRRNHSWSVDELIIIKQGVNSKLYNKLSIIKMKYLYKFANKFRCINDVLLMCNKFFLKRAKINNMGRWSEYQSVESLKFVLECAEEGNGLEIQFSRYKEVVETLKSLQHKTVLEFGANLGLFATVACKYCPNITKYIATDYDDVAINELYKFVRDHKKDHRWLSKIQTMVIDFTGEYAHRDWEPISNRIRSDVVICMAVTHHLILSQGINIDEIFKYFKLVSNRYLIVEFMPLGLWGGTDIFPELPDWYTLEWFLECMKKYFYIKKIEKLEPNRVMIVGELILDNREKNDD